MNADAARREFDESGYTIARQLFSAEEAATLKRYFINMVERGGEGRAEGGTHPDDEDPLKRYPRLMQPHRSDKVAMDYMVDPRINAVLTALLDREPLAVQTMVYFKPPGARGQALHQDQRYLKVDPGTCIAAWMALDPCDEQNGCLEVVPGSQDLEMLCPVPADTNESFTSETVQVPPGLSTVTVPMNPGDVLFFNGSLIHGSPANRSDRFRTIIVGHYIVGEAERVGEFYHPVYRMDGSIAALGVNADAQPCGQFVERDGSPVFETTGTVEAGVGAH